MKKLITKKLNWIKEYRWQVFAVIFAVIFLSGSLFVKAKVDEFAKKINNEKAYQSLNQLKPTLTPTPTPTEVKSEEPKTEVKNTGPIRKPHTVWGGETYLFTDAEWEQYQIDWKAFVDKTNAEIKAESDAFLAEGYARIEAESKVRRAADKARLDEQAAAQERLNNLYKPSDPNPNDNLCSTKTYVYPGGGEQTKTVCMPRNQSL